MQSHVYSLAPSKPGKKNKSKPKAKSKPKLPKPTSLPAGQIREEVRRQLKNDREFSTSEKECLKEYARAVTNPFIVRGLPCNPNRDTGLSMRWKTRARGTMVVGTQGVGWIVFNPYNGAASVSGYQTTVGYASTDLDTNLGGVTPITALSPVTSMSRTKIVGWALKISPVAPPLGLQGSIYRLRTTRNDPTIVNLTTTATIQNSPMNIMQPVRYNQTYYANFIAQDDADHTFRASTASSALVPNWVLGFYVIGGAVSHSYAWELCAFYEGLQDDETTMGNASISPEYPVGGKKIVNATILAEQQSYGEGFGLNSVIDNVAKAMESSLASYTGDSLARAIADFAKGKIYPHNEL